MTGKKRKKGRKMGPFRIAAVFLGVAALVMLSRFPAKAVSLERQQAQLEAAATAYYDAQSRYNQLNTELAESSSVDFIERTARRMYGYCWYGETVYEVGNLDELKATEDIEVFDQQ